MKNLVIVDEPDKWPMYIPNVEIISGREYLTSEDYRTQRNIRVFNLCSSYKYQTLGYYVSLLAEARGHKPMPSVSTIQDLKQNIMIKFASNELNDIIQRDLADIKSEEFTLSIYFGKNLAKRYDRLSSHLYRMFHAPFVRAIFQKEEKWVLKRVGPLEAKDIPPSHHEMVISFASQYFAKKDKSVKKKKDARFSIAILVNPEEEMPPSDKRAVNNFVKAAHQLNIEVELVTKDDFSRLAEFDGLFIRETTAVNHHTFRFSRRAAGLGLVVFDDPDSILKCTNKVYLHELVTRAKILHPKTMILHQNNLLQGLNFVGLPCVIKQPDGSFSNGVIKANNEFEYFDSTKLVLERSDLFVAQEFVQTDFDWRVGILAGEPLFVCQYFMAKHHWQIIKRCSTGKRINGKVMTMSPKDAPHQLISLATKAAKLIGNGLYGVDIKQVGNKFYLIEVNDNPNIDADVEDLILGKHLYLKIMQCFLDRMIAKINGREEI